MALVRSAAAGAADACGPSQGANATGAGHGGAAHPRRARHHRRQHPGDHRHRRRRFRVLLQPLRLKVRAVRGRRPRGAGGVRRVAGSGLRRPDGLRGDLRRRRTDDGTASPDAARRGPGAPAGRPVLRSPRSKDSRHEPSETSDAGSPTAGSPSRTPGWGSSRRPGASSRSCRRPWTTPTSSTRRTRTPSPRCCCACSA